MPERYLGHDGWLEELNDEAAEAAEDQTWTPTGGENTRWALVCPECGEPIWDFPLGHKLAKCWNIEGHADGGTLAFDTMEEEDDA